MNFSNYIQSDLIPIRVFQKGKKQRIIIAKQFCQTKAMKLLGINVKSLRWNEDANHLEVHMN